MSEPRSGSTSGTASTREHDRWPLVGRDRERLLLHEQLAAALAGPGRLVLLNGGAGIGKTPLLTALAEEARQEGALLLSGACYDLSDTPPYGPWAELCARLPEIAGRPPASRSTI